MENRDVIRFKIAPYALFDTLKALDNTKDHSRHLEYGVTKCDNELEIWVREVYTAHTGEVGTCRCPEMVEGPKEPAVEKEKHIIKG